MLQANTIIVLALGSLKFHLLKIGEKVSLVPCSSCKILLCFHTNAIPFHPGLSLLLIEGIDCCSTAVLDLPLGPVTEVREKSLFFFKKKKKTSRIAFPSQYNFSRRGLGHAE